MTNREFELKACELKELFIYNASTGELYWGVRRGSAGKGCQAGSITTKGYLRVQLRGRTYATHQIAWAIHYGRWAERQIDHINGDKLDNRIGNLREATNSQNSRNRTNSRNSSGYKGVSFHKRQNKYNARIMADGKMIHLGSFDNPMSAAKAYNDAATDLHGEFASLNNFGACDGKAA